MIPDREVPYTDHFVPEDPPEEAARRFHAVLSRRRSVRAFSPRPVAQEVVEWIIRAAGSAPSGANRQPWRFVCVRDPALKREIRLAAEAEEREFYTHRASERWLKALEPLGTGASKPFLEDAPWLIVVFQLVKGDDGAPVYYPLESVGIAVGMLLAAAQFAGLATLPHTPSPMRFLGRILRRPSHERPFLLIPLGYPADDCHVPAAAQQRKALSEIMLLDCPEDKERCSE